MAIPPIDIDSNRSGVAIGGDRANLSIQLTPPLFLRDQKFTLRHVGKIPFTIQNVNAAVHANSTLRYSIDTGANWNTLTIADGLYEAGDITLAVNALLIQNGHYYEDENKENVYAFQILFSDIDGKTYVKLNEYKDDLGATVWDKDTIIVDLTNDGASNLYTLLGFTQAEKNAITGATRTFSAADTDILGLQSEVVINCNLVDSLSEIGTSHVLYRAKWNTAKQSAMTTPTSSLENYKAMINTPLVDRIDIRITDTGGNLMKFYGTARDANIYIRLIFEEYTGPMIMRR